MVVSSPLRAHAISAPSGDHATGPSLISAGRPRFLPDGDTTKARERVGSDVTIVTSRPLGAQAATGRSTPDASRPWWRPSGRATQTLFRRANRRRRPSAEIWGAK